MQHRHKILLPVAGSGNPHERSTGCHRLESTRGAKKREPSHSTHWLTLLPPPTRPVAMLRNQSGLRAFANTESCPPANKRQSRESWFSNRSRADLDTFVHPRSGAIKRGSGRSAGLPGGCVRDVWGRYSGSRPHRRLSEGSLQKGQQAVSSIHDSLRQAP